MKHGLAVACVKRTLYDLPLRQILDDGSHSVPRSVFLVTTIQEHPAQFTGNGFLLPFSPSRVKCSGKAAFFIYFQTDFHRLAAGYLVRYRHSLYRERVFLLNIQVITTRAKTKKGSCNATQYHHQVKYLFHFSYGFSHYKMYLIPKPYWIWKCFAALPQRMRSRRRSNRTTLSERYVSTSSVTAPP